MCIYISIYTSIYHPYIYYSCVIQQMDPTVIYLSVINLPIIQISTYWSIYLSPIHWSTLRCCAAGVGRLGASVAAPRPAVQPSVPPAQQQAQPRRRRHRGGRRRRRRWLHQHQPGRRGRGVARVWRPHIRLKNWWGRHRLWLSLVGRPMTSNGPNGTFLSAAARQRERHSTVNIYTRLSPLCKSYVQYFSK